MDSIGFNSGYTKVESIGLLIALLPVSHGARRLTTTTAHAFIITRTNIDCNRFIFFIDVFIRRWKIFPYLHMENIVTERKVEVVRRIFQVTARLLLRALLHRRKEQYKEKPKEAVDLYYSLRGKITRWCRKRKVSLNLSRRSRTIIIERLGMRIHRQTNNPDH